MSVTATATAPAKRRVPALPLTRIFTFPIALACLLAVLGLLTVRDRLNDPDMWWHLKMGQVIYTSHTVPVTDIFSYTTNHHAWTAHEWLAQLSIYGAYRLGGLSGLMAWLACLTAAILISGYVLCSLASGNVKTGFAGAMLIWFFSTAGLAVRPQMVGYFFLILELVLLQVGRKHNPRWFFGLPLLFGVWVNCHGSYFLGFALACVILACSLFELRWGLLVASRWPRPQTRMLCFALLLCGAAFFLNPNGIRQILYPINTMLHQPLGLTQVEEWQPLSLTAARGLGLTAALGVIFLTVIVRRCELFLDELLSLIIGAWFAVAHQRMTFVFGILAAPLLCRLLAPFMDDYDRSKDQWLPNALLMVCGAFAVLLAFPGAKSLTRQVADGNPVQAVNYINTHLAGRMLNDYVYGGYLIWAAPEHPVFIDGRADVFEWTGVLQDFARWSMLTSDPDTLLNKYKVDFCLLRRDAPMAEVLALMPDWKLTYSDRQSVIYSRVHAL